MEIIAELVGFVIIILVLYRFVWPLVKKMVADRQNVVQQQVDDAAEAERKLAEAQQRYDSAVAEARNEAARIRDDARADALSIREELKEQAEAEVERIKQRGEEQLAAERDQVVRQLRSELGAQAMQLAERIVVDQLSDEKRRSTTVDGFLNDIDQLPARGTDSRQAAPVGGGAI
ncbi:F0F1 ATP synthase subunit B [Pseudonocardia sp.]|jgi:F-type H+-transporting ATPase subunit b|uniref:F0F1 ATP synthase subunit B n=1 Tax=Pseudonocardia sp. TaxID=60912 RepID=UPI002628E410|nr:F0F1 ATP synthase subunit B [Pseudonocardia sp.]MCW2721816.1 synthase subunit b [Pseudonocardia sp.]MDT7613969.1 F-type H+-transporting ATPase subunit b [Pseudonocardiales bacterium]